MNEPQIDPDSFVPIADQIELQQPPMNNQEWTSKDVWNLLDEGGGQMVADAHNSELRAERDKLLQAHEVLKRIRMRHSNNDSTTREIDVALMEVKQ